MAENRKAPIRILHVLTAMNRAGAETMLMNLYRAIDRERVQFDFAVTAKETCDYDGEILSLGGKIIHYPKYTGKNLFAYKKWWDTFFRSHPEYRIIHGHIGSTASIYLKIAKEHGRYTIAHSHSTGGMNVHDVLYKVLSYNTRFIADYFFGCSTEALISRYGKAITEQPEKSCVLRNGIDVQRYKHNEETCRTVREQLGLSQDTLVVGTVGRFTEAKNVFFIVDILENLKKRIPDYRFLWAGTGELKDQIVARIAEKNLQENILLLGVREDVPELLQAMNVFILPSKYEGLPVIGVEVQAAGLPMLCSDKVSPELKISNCISFLSVDSTNPWVDGILQERTFRRIEDAPMDVAQAGYDVRTTSRWLLAFYEDKLKCI